MPDSSFDYLFVALFARARMRIANSIHPGGQEFPMGLQFRYLPFAAGEIVEFEWICV